MQRSEWHVPPQIPSVNPTRIAFVGEAPSDEELEKMEPFVGPSGRLFNSLLRSANLEREEFLITNVFDQQAPDNDVTGWVKDDTRVAESFARLNEEIAAYKPTVVVPLGGTALWAFTGETLISKFRGAVSAARRISPGHKLLPTYHPQFVQKNWNALPMVVGDLIKASAEADLGPEITYPHVTMLIEPTLQDVIDFAWHCKESPKLSVDIETGWGQITSIAFAPSTTLAMSIPFVDLRKPNKCYWPTVTEEVAVWRIVEEILEAPNPKVGQNYMYDLFWLYNRHGIATRNYRYDTRLRHKVLYPELPADLASMSASYTRVGAYKMWGGRYQKATDKKDG